MGLIPGVPPGATQTRIGKTADGELLADAPAPVAAGFKAGNAGQILDEIINDLVGQIYNATVANW